MDIRAAVAGIVSTAAVFAWAGEAAQAQDITYSDVEISGNVADDPRPDNDGTFNTFAHPTISNNSQIVFNATAIGALTEAGLSCGAGLWDQLVNIDCGTITGGNAKDNNRLAFYRQAAPNFSSLSPGILSNRTGSLNFVAIVGTATPDELATFVAMGNPALNSSGHTTFYGSTSGGYTHGLFTEGGGLGLAVLAKPGSVVPIPGSVADGTLSQVANAATINAAGQSLVLAQSDQGTGIWVGTNRAVAVADTEVPLGSLPGDWVAGATFGNISISEYPDINGKGEVAFSAPINSGPAPLAIFAERFDAGSGAYLLHEVARLGDAVNRNGRVDPVSNPACLPEDCLTFATRLNTVVMNDAGDLAFVACESNIPANCGIVKAQWNSGTGEYVRTPE